MPQEAVPAATYARSMLRIDSNFYRLLVVGLTVCVGLSVWMHRKVFLMDTSLAITTTSWAVETLQEVVHPHLKYVPQKPKRSSKKAKPKLTEHKKKKKPLNILLLYADDWRWDSLGVQGNPFVKTPFLDRMARTRGIRFERNMVTTSICWMSRATLHTGLYASQHKGWMPDQPHWYHRWYESFPYLMKHESNYAMAHVGKWDYLYFHDIPAIHETYNYSRIYHAKHWYSKAEIEQEVSDQTTATGQPGYNTQYKTHLEGDDERIHVTDRTVADAMEFLEHRPQDQPFMLTVSFFPPHSVDGTDAQWYPQPETAEAYLSDQTILPPVPPAHSVENMNQSFARLPHSIFRDGDGNEARTRWHLRFDNERKYNAMMKRYYQMITGVDTACEKLVAELERQGILNDTLIIFTTDNGFYHGEHGLAGKWFPHEESIRVPLIVMDPRAPPSSRGSVNGDLTLNIDLAPYLLGAAQTSVPKQMQGRDFSQLYLHNTGYEPWREEFFYEYPQFWNEVFLPASTALVRKSYKYIQWGADPATRVEQLFDLIQDPREEMDVFSDPEYAYILFQMRQRHAELQQECCRDINVMGEKRFPVPNNSWISPMPGEDSVGNLASQLEDWRLAAS